MRLAPLLLACLSACTDIPDLPGTQHAPDTARGYPALVPLGPLLAQAQALDTGGRITPATTANMAARMAALNARAARLRGPVIASATLVRLRRPIATSALQ